MSHGKVSDNGSELSDGIGKVQARLVNVVDGLGKDSDGPWKVSNGLGRVSAGLELVSDNPA